MPELPDVENYCRYLQRHGLHKKIEAVTVEAPPRKLGRVELVDDADDFIRSKKLGPDAASVDEKTFRERLGSADSHAFACSQLKPSVACVKQHVDDLPAVFGFREMEIVEIFR